MSTALVIHRSFPIGKGSIKKSAKKATKRKGPASSKKKPQSKKKKQKKSHVCLQGEINEIAVLFSNRRFDADFKQEAWVKVFNNNVSEGNREAVLQSIIIQERLTISAAACDYFDEIKAGVIKVHEAALVQQGSQSRTLSELNRVTAIIDACREKMQELNARV